MIMIHRSSIQRGFSYIEVMIATLLIAVTLVPAINSLQTGVKSTGTHRNYLEAHLNLKGKMEDILAQSFSSLETEAGNPTVPNPTYSDAVGAPDRRLVYLAPYDGDNLDSDDDPFTGGDTGLVWVRVEIEGSAHGLQTLTSP